MALTTEAEEVEGKTAQVTIDGKTFDDLNLAYRWFHEQYCATKSSWYWQICAAIEWQLFISDDEEYTKDL